MAAFNRLLDDALKSEKAIAQATAARARHLDRLRRCSEEMAAGLPDEPTVREGWSPAVRARRELAYELSCALRVPERTALCLVWESQVLVNELPATLRALEEGEISYRHAQVMVNQATSIPEEARTEFEESLLPPAKSLTVATFTDKARKARERLHPDSIRERHVAAVEDRTVWVDPDTDGMSHFGAHISAEHAAGMMDRITEIAMKLVGADDERTLAQKRADVFTDLLLTGDTCAALADAEPGDAEPGDAEPAGHGLGLGHGIRPKVLVMVPVMTLLGASDEPAHLEGYGPIDPETARALAAKAASFTRILTHPVSSAILDVDRTRYAVPADLRLTLRVRDETCRAFGCRRSAGRCDVDHTVDWALGGTTSIDNLNHLCQTHHSMKQFTRVRMRNAAGGDVEWTTPSGRVYRTSPANRLRMKATV